MKIIDTKDKQLEFLYRDVKEYEAQRKSIQEPHNRFLNILSEAIATREYAFGGKGSWGREQYAKAFKGVAYFTAGGLNKFLKDFDILGEKEAIIEGLEKSNNYKKSKRTDRGIDGDENSSTNRVNRIEIRFEDEEFPGFSLKDNYWWSNKQINGEFIMYPNDEEGIKDLKDYLMYQEEKEN